MYYVKITQNYVRRSDNGVFSAALGRGYLGRRLSIIGFYGTVRYRTYRTLYSSSS